MANDAQVLDFTNVKEGGGSFNKKRLPAGDYLAKVTKVETTKPKDKSDKTPMWLFSISVERNGKVIRTFPYYCKLQENQLWKIRNLFAAAGIAIPKKRVKLDPSRVVGKLIGVTLEDDEYEGKEQSTIDAVIPASEVSGTVAAEDDEDEETEDEEETEDSDEEDEDEEEELAYSDSRDGLKAYIKTHDLDVAVKKSMSDDDIREAIKAAEADSDEEDEDEDEEPEEAPKAVAKKSKKKTVTDDELEELDIDEI